MNLPMRRRWVVRGAIACLCWLLPAAVAVGAPVYQGDTAKEPRDLVAFEQESVRMAIPKGYAAHVLPANSGAELKHWFVNRSRSANFQVFCYPPEMDKAKLEKDIVLAAMANLGEAVQSIPTQAVDDSEGAAEFAAYAGTTVVQNRFVPLTLLVAWKVPNRSDGCKYGLLAVVATPAAEAFLPEFVAIVRSLQ